jgi:hypothetical protein
VSAHGEEQIEELTLVEILRAPDSPLIAAGGSSSTDRNIAPLERIERAPVKGDARCPRR